MDLVHACGPWGHGMLQELAFGIRRPERYLLVNRKDEVLVIMEMLVKNKSFKVEVSGNHLDGTQ